MAKRKLIVLAVNFACWSIGMRWRVENGLEHANGVNWSMQ